MKRRENSIDFVSYFAILMSFRIRIFVCRKDPLQIKKKGSGTAMEPRLALIGIIVEDTDSTEKINAILHEYGEYIIGRMGVPHARRHVSVISVIIDGPGDIISALSGKLGMLPGVTTKTIYSKTSVSAE